MSGDICLDCGRDHVRATGPCPHCAADRANGVPIRWHIEETPPHPELRDGEIFVGNHEGELPKYVAGLKTVRLGEQAFYLGGKPIEKERGLRPMFVHKSEEMAYDRIMSQRLSNIARGIPNDNE